MLVKEEVYMAKTECHRLKDYTNVMVIGKSKGGTWYSVSHHSTIFQCLEELLRRIKCFFFKKSFQGLIAKIFPRCIVSHPYVTQSVNASNCAPFFMIYSYLSNSRPQILLLVAITHEKAPLLF